MENQYREFLQAIPKRYFTGAYREADNTISGIFAVAMDVTEQVIARKKTEEAEEKARLAVNLAHLGVFELTYATNELIADKTIPEMMGFDQVVSREEFAATIHPEDLSVREQAHKISLISGQLDYKSRVIWKDKSIHWLRFTGKVLFDKDKAVNFIEEIEALYQKQQTKIDIDSVTQQEIPEQERNVLVLSIHVAGEWQNVLRLLDLIGSMAHKISISSLHLNQTQVSNETGSSTPMWSATFVVNAVMAK